MIEKQWLKSYCGKPIIAFLAKLRVQLIYAFSIFIMGLRGEGDTKDMMKAMKTRVIVSLFINKKIYLDSQSNVS